MLKHWAILNHPSGMKMTLTSSLSGGSTDNHQYALVSKRRCGLVLQRPSYVFLPGTFMVLSRRANGQ